MPSINLTPVLPPLVTGLTIQSGVRTATLSWNAIEGMTYQVWMAINDNVQASVLVSAVESNSFAATGLTQGAFFYVRAVNAFGVYGPTTAGVQYVPQAITSADVSGTTVGAAGVGVSATSSNATVSNYGQWYKLSTAAFTAVDDALLSVSLNIYTMIGSVTTPGLSSANVWVRTRLRDTTLNADVPGATKQSLVYYKLGSIIDVGQLKTITNVHENFVAGFRGVLVPGHNYEFYGEVMMERSDASASVTISGTGSSLSTSSSASF